MPALQINQEGLPYPDPLHPIIIHFVIAMVFFVFFCDVVGYFTRKHHLFEVSSWNMLVASVAIFLAIIMGQFEAGLAQPYAAAKSALTAYAREEERRQALLAGFQLHVPKPINPSELITVVANLAGRII